MIDRADVSVGLFLPQFEQKFVVLIFRQSGQTQSGDCGSGSGAGSGFLAPQFPQKFPVFSVEQFSQIHDSADAAMQQKIIPIAVTSARIFLLIQNLSFTIIRFFGK